MQAVIFTSNTGFTAEYAKLLGQKTRLPVFSLEQAKKNLAPSSKVIYLGWLLAGTIQGYKEAARIYDVCAVCGVGMGSNGSQIGDVKKNNHLSEALPVFVLQGGFDMSRLRGIYKFMMRIMSGTMGKKLSEKQDKTPEEADMLDLLRNGGNRVCEENLSPLLEWYAGVAESSNIPN